MTGRLLEDFTVGQTFRSGRRQIDTERIKTFGTEFDPQPFHLDEETARDTIPFSSNSTRGRAPRWDGLGYKSSKAALTMVSVLFAHELRDTPIKVHPSCSWFDLSRARAEDLVGKHGFGTPEEGA